MPQFFVDPRDVDEAGGKAVLGAEETRHLERVLRLRPGAGLVIFDGGGRRWATRLGATEGGRASVSELRRLGSNEPAVSLELIQGLPKGERWEWLLEKGTELGIARFRPVYTEHGVARLPASRVPARLERWRKIALAAAKQCERGVVPEVVEPLSLADVTRALPPGGVGEARLALTERAGEVSELPPVAAAGRILLAVGPEGGWSSGDRRLLQAAGFQPWSLGSRILRAETAALAGVAILVHGR